MITFTEKYKPKKLTQVIGQNQAASLLFAFYRQFPRRRAAILHGPPGSGKTALAHALTSQNKLELIELNASDKRNKASVEELLGPASQQASIFGTKKLIVIDEIDGISGTKDRGAIPAIIKIIKETKFPIIITANDPWSSKLRTLRNYCDMVQLRKVNYLSIAKHLKLIAEKEKIKFDERAITKLAASVDGDMRAALNDLQAMSLDGKLTNEDLVIWGREKEESIFNTMKLIFKSKDAKLALESAKDLTENIETLNFWIEENISLEYSQPALSRAYDNLSDSDIFLNRIRRWQHWRFLIYANQLSVAGVQQAKDKANEKFIKHKKPTMLMKLFIRAAKRKKYRGLADQVSDKLHASSRVLQKDFVPYFDFITEHNKEMGKELELWFSS